MVELSDTAALIEIATSLRTPHEVKSAIEVLFREGKGQEALALARTIYTHCPHIPPNVRSLLLARACMRTDREAEAISVLNVADRTLDIAILLAELHVKNDCPDEAQVLLTEIERQMPEKMPSSTRFRVARLAIQTETGKLAFDALCAVLCANDLILNHFYQTLGYLLSPLCAEFLPALDEAVIRAAEQQLETFDDTFSCRLRLADLLGRIGQSERSDTLLSLPKLHQTSTLHAIPLLKRQVADGDATPAITAAKTLLLRTNDTPKAKTGVLLFLANTLFKADRADDFAEVLRNWNPDQNGDFATRELATVLRQTGNDELLDTMRGIKAARIRADLPESLSAGLAALPYTPGPAMTDVPEAMLMPFRLSGLPDDAWPEWSARQGWGCAASAFIRRWALYSGSDGRQDVLDLIDPVDISVLEDAMGLGRGGILVGTHAGPVYASFATFENLRWPFAYVGRGGATEQTRATGILWAGSSPDAMVKSILTHLKENRLVGVTADAHLSGRTRSVAVGGATLRVSRLVARLSFARGIPSVWYESRWRDGRLEVRLTAMPLPEPRESREDWEDRWFAAYQARLSDFLASAPENLSGLQGWTSGQQ